jgi:hypothetical protein
MLRRKNSPAPLFIVTAAMLIASGCAPSDDETRGFGNGIPPSHSSSGTSQQAVSDLPPITGGTLLVTRDHALAFAADPDRDRVVIADLATGKVVTDVAVEEGSMPGRSVEDGEGRVHVVLRETGIIMTLDRAGNVLAMRAVCTGPRGIDVDGEQLLVACVTGDLVRMGVDPSSGVDERVDLGTDLRDVVVSGGKVFVSRFRSAEILVLDHKDEIAKSVRLPTVDDTMESTVAWRMTPWPTRGVYVSHQRSSNAEIIVGDDAPAGAYDQDGHSVVEMASSTVDEHGQVVETGSMVGGALPVDASVNEAGTLVATVAASTDVVFTMPTADGDIQQIWDVPGEPVAVRFAGPDIVVQTREPSTLLVIADDGSQSAIDLGGESKRGVGHSAFHRSSVGPASLSCASCHPEGREDGHIWNFANLGARRTQSLLGGIAREHSFHWDGELATFGDLVDEIYVGRMGNAPLSDEDSAEFETWIDALQDLPSADAPLAEGRAVFEKAHCDSCHSGERFTNEGMANVGTGGAFKVPSLVGVRYRAPFLHDGCAPTLEDRFGSCGGNQHGDVKSLDDGELASLIDYLEKI